MNISTEEKKRVIENIEKILSEILSEKYDAKITITFTDQQ